MLVSIDRRRLWACAWGQTRYQSPVITGIKYIPADLTPAGTYRVYGKQRGVWLNGSDSTGTWHDYVHYWMPFLVNQYGTYGFHDATWRSPSQFGSVRADSSHASRGCVELPLHTARWLYGWVRIGTTVSVVQ